MKKFKDGSTHLEADDTYLAAVFSEDTFELGMNGKMDGAKVLSMICHLAEMLEERSGVTVEETAQAIIESQGKLEREEKE